MVSRLFLRGAVLQLRRSFKGGGLPLPNGGGLPLPSGGGFSRPLVGFSQSGGWAGRPRTGRLDLPGAARFYSGSGSGGQSSAWLDWVYNDFVPVVIPALLPVFILDRSLKYELETRLEKLEIAAEKRSKKRTVESN